MNNEIYKLSFWMDGYSEEEGSQFLFTSFDGVINQIVELMEKEDLSNSEKSDIVKKIFKFQETGHEQHYVNDIFNIKFSKQGVYGKEALSQKAIAFLEN